MSKRYIGGRMIEVADPNTQAVIRTTSAPAAAGASPLCPVENPATAEVWVLTLSARDDADYSGAGAVLAVFATAELGIAACAPLGYLTGLIEPVDKQSWVSSETGLAAESSDGMTTLELVRHGVIL